MKKDELLNLIKTNREIEFKYNNNKYSITYYNDNRLKRISVCLFNCNPVDVATAEEVLNLTIGKITIQKIFEGLPDIDIEVF